MSTNEIPLASSDSPDRGKRQQLNEEFLGKNPPRRTVPGQRPHRQFWEKVRQEFPDLDFFLNNQGRNLDALPEPMTKDEIFKFLGTIVRPEYQPLVEQVFSWIIKEKAKLERLEVLASDIEELAQLGVLDQLINQRRNGGRRE